MLKFIKRNISPPHHGDLAMQWNIHTSTEQAGKEKLNE
jgi:hypothetical protein